MGQPSPAHLGASPPVNPGCRIYRDVMWVLLISGAPRRGGPGEFGDAFVEVETE
jgi:hypothetical protein